MTYHPLRKSLVKTVITTRALLAICCVLFPLSAAAIPMHLSHQGRIMDSTDTPITGSVELTLTLYDAETEGNSLWTESQHVAFDNGFYSITLGTEQALEISVFEGDDVYLGITLGEDGELSPRHWVTSVPYAFRAGAVEDGALDDYLTSNNYVTDEHYHVSSDISDFETAVQDLAVPGFSGSYNDLEDIPSDFPPSDHSHDAADISGIPDSLADTTIPGDLAITNLVANGGVSLGNDQRTCESDLAGTLRWNANHVEVCDGTTWKSIYEQPQDGLTQETSGQSCNSILADGNSEDGVYWIDPNGEDTDDAFQVYCDMTNDGGGWIKMEINHTNQVICKGNADKFEGETVWAWLSDGQLNAVDIGGPENEWINVDVSYKNPATDDAFTDSQLSLLRTMVTDLSDTTRMTIQDDDSDTDGNTYNCGHQYYHAVKVVAEDNSEIFTQEKVTGHSTGGGSPSYSVTYWTEDSREYAGHPGTVCFSVPEFLEAKYLIPDRIMHYDGSGGGACWGYEQNYFLVK